MTSPLRVTLPPPAVLSLLKEKESERKAQRDNFERCRKRCHSASPQTCRTYRKRHEKQQLVRQQHISQQEDQQPSQRKTSQTYTFRRPFSLSNSIEQSVERLGRIGKELENVSRDLSHVVELHRLNSTGESFSSDDSELSTSSTTSPVMADMESTSSYTSTTSASERLLSYDLCCSATQDLHLADLARHEFKTILVDLEAAWVIEEKEMVSRANILKRQSADRFVKMNPEALRRLRKTSRSDSTDGDFTEEDEEDGYEALDDLCFC